MDTAASLLGRLPRGRAQVGFKVLRPKLKPYIADEHMAIIEAAYVYAEKAHDGQTRKSGAPYITHPLAVAGILADLRMDHQTLMAALLHDVIEDTEIPRADITERFGAEVADLVDGVSKLDQIKFKSKAEAQVESFRKMMLAMVKDIRVILVKLADRLHNMRTLGAMPSVKRRRIARETLEIYAPIANRLGMHAFRLELEDLGFQALYPQRYKIIEKSIKKSVGNQRQLIRKISANLSRALAEHDIDAEVRGREKHRYSIYQKMRKKGRSLTEIVDVFGFRIVADSADACYRVLGVVHSVYKPMPGRFKDYVAIPKVNGYQSLHTTLFGPNGMPIEVQIRTADMDELAERGIAAHWRYKTDEKSRSASRKDPGDWLKRLEEMQASGSSEEFLESVKIDLFPDKVYVFTPRGDILRLPRGATTVDFAYAVHTDVGNRCVATKVDRRLVPLRTPLRNGQTVEIITAKGARPNPAWMNFVVTAKARASIRHYLKNLKHNEAIALGKRLVDKALTELSLKLRKIPADRVRDVAQQLGLSGPEEMFEQVGLGKRLAPLLARSLAPETTEEAPRPERSAPLAISGTEDMVVSFARCCFPLPGDAIMGYLSAGRGIVIHRENCGNLAEFRKQPDKWLEVEWKNEPDREFSVEIRADVVNRMGVLAAVAANIAGTESNIEHVSVDERDGNTSCLTFLLQLKDRNHLARVMRSIRGMPEVLRVSRTCA